MNQGNTGLVREPCAWRHARSQWKIGSTDRTESQLPRANLNDSQKVIE
jgi:hypothetical protein